MTDARNAEVYGKCNNRFGHGHNYFVEVTVAGPVAPDTGFVVDMMQLDAVAKREIVDRFDNVHLNSDPAFAAECVPSTENLAFEIERVFKAAMPALDPTGRLQLARVRIEETGKNSFELTPANVERTIHPPA